MPNYDQVVNRWISIALGTTNTTRQLRNERMPVDGDRIFSYGSHFEIGRLIRDRKGKPRNWLLNGDTWGPTTSGHQSHVRGSVQRTGLPVVIIPHAALNAAGIDRDIVRILDVTADRHEEIREVHYEVPSRCTLRWEEQRERVGMELDELYAAVDKYNIDEYTRWAAEQNRCWAEDDKYGVRTSARRRHMFTKCPTALTLAEWLHVQLDQGSSWDRTNVIESATAEVKVTHYQLVCRPNGSSYCSWEIRYLPDGRTEFSRTRHRHWLGESLIEGEIEYALPKRCKWCRATGRAEGPVSANWIPPQDETKWMPRGAFDPTTGEPIGVYGQFTTGRIIPGYWEDNRRWVPLCSACRGRGRWTEPRTRRAKFLSGFDANESRPSYFFCELPPRCTATTVTEAYDALKPDAVKLAEQMGRDVHRQGDIFAIPLSTTSRAQLRKMGARFERMGRLLNTNHAATDAAFLPDGTTIVRGVLHHVPADRRPDHARVKLGDGKQWYVIQKNTVPLAA